MVSDPSQSLQLTGLGKSPTNLPTAIKVQLQMEGVLSPHKGHISSTQLEGQEDCATRPYRTPTALGHATNTGRHSSPNT